MRLIDGDALIAQIEQNICKPCKERKLDYNGVRCRACQYGDEIDDIYDAPTVEEWVPITEAEPGAAHVLATLRWDEDDYEVTEMDYHAIVAAQGDKDMMISAGAKNVIKHVIAWMPLPEPAKLESE